MDLLDVAGSDAENVLQSGRRVDFLSKLSSNVESLQIDLDKSPCQALVRKIEEETQDGSSFVEMAKVKTLHITGSPRSWRCVEEQSPRLLQFFRTPLLEELSITGPDEFKVVKSILSDCASYESLKSLTIGLHGFQFWSEDELLAFEGLLKTLRRFRTLGIDSRGNPYRENHCRMFLCANSLVDFLVRWPNPELVEALHISNAVVLGEEATIVNLLRLLASFKDLKQLRLPLPSLPLTFREMLTIRLSLRRLIYFDSEGDIVTGSETWPERQEDAWRLAKVWSMPEAITPLSLFSREFSDFFQSDEDASHEWSRLADAERNFWLEAASKIKEAYQNWECTPAGRGHPSHGQDACEISSSTTKAAPEPRQFGEKQVDPANLINDLVEVDARPASTHEVGDWQSEGQSAYCGILRMKAADVCKEKSRVRREFKWQVAPEGGDLSPPSCANRNISRATPDRANSTCAEELFDGNGTEQCCGREDDLKSSELGVFSSTMSF